MEQELNRAKLRGRFRQRDESLPEDVERLARLAYPDAADSMILTLAKDQFIDALEDEDTRLRIRQLRPENLQRALETALEMESYGDRGNLCERFVWRVHPGSGISSSILGGVVLPSQRS